jgi:hypothetical protein
VWKRVVCGIHLDLGIAAIVANATFASIVVYVVEIDEPAGQGQRRSPPAYRRGMMAIMKTFSARVSGVAAVAVCGALLLAACGSSSHSPAATGTTPAVTTPAATTPGATTPASTPASSKPYTVMVITVITDAQSYKTPEVVPAVKAAFAGTGVKVISCDDEFTSAQDLVCEHKAVTDHVAAVISGSSSLSADESILNQAGIPVLGTADGTSPVSFAVSNAEGDYVAIGVGLYQAGCRRLGILYLDGTDVLASAIQQGGKWQSVTKAAIPINAPDLTASITKLGEGKVDCIAISTFPTTVIQATTAIKQDGLNVKVGMTAAIANPQVLKALGSQANGLIVAEASILNPDDTAPVVGQIKSEMKAIDPSAPVTDLAILGWASAKLILDAAPSISGPVTAASMLTALNGLRNAGTDGAIPPFSAVPLTNPAYKRFFNHYDITYVVQNGVFTRLSNYYDLTAALDG